MPSEFYSLLRELNEDVTPEQIEEEEENMMMCAAEEEDAYNEVIEIDEQKEKDEDNRMLDTMLSSGEIQFQNDDSFIEDIQMRELIFMTKTLISTKQFESTI
tara:strand:- start:2652 stop:2957 length:306 start_codon:yes stop_codon:yes gene_type:complete